MNQAVALSPGSLLGQDVITTAATPLMGYINVYNLAGGPLAPPLRQAALGTLGTTTLIELDPNDTSGNALTITCYLGETFWDGVSSTRTLTRPGSYVVLQLAATTAGVARWKEVGSGPGTPGTPANPGTALDCSVPNSLPDPATETTRFGEHLPTDTGYGRYGDGGLYGYGY